ncbi:MAG: hypothetical protein IJT58_07300 [Synergistaceae bacterium]|nr:hypothetical protein [Synergistaceae bacterium]
MLRAWNVITELFTWSVNKFGEFLGGILAFLGFASFSALLGFIAKIIIEGLVKKFMFPRIMEAAQKFIAKKTPEKNPNAEAELPPAKPEKRELTKDDIIKITEKYGYTREKNEKHWGESAYTSWIFAGWTWYTVAFCESGVFTEKGLWDREEDFLTYKELRNDDKITMAYLKKRYEGFPDEFYNVLVELKEY